MAIVLDLAPSYCVVGLPAMIRPLHWGEGTGWASVQRTMVVDSLIETPVDWRCRVKREMGSETSEYSVVAFVSRPESVTSQGPA